MVREMKERRSRDVRTDVGVSVSDLHGGGITRYVSEATHHDLYSIEARPKQGIVRAPASRDSVGLVYCTASGYLFPPVSVAHRA